MLTSDELKAIEMLGVMSEALKNVCSQSIDQEQIGRHIYGIQIIVMKNAALRAHSDIFMQNPA